MDIRFRTEIEPMHGASPLSHAQAIMLVGSCFTDHIGSRLEHDGFNTAINPMGILFNPASIAGMLDRGADRRMYLSDEMIKDSGVWHALDYESKWRDTDADALTKRLNERFAAFADDVEQADVIIITFGTAYVYEWAEDGRIVGNCHKIDNRKFIRRRMTVDEIVGLWKPLLSRFSDRRFIYTVSPVRHLADGLHGNQLSKATLLLAVEKLCEEPNAEYFPAYEILNDDLRDYRFYAADLKHPSETAADYIYEKFSLTYFDKRTLKIAEMMRREHLREQHRQIL